MTNLTNKALAVVSVISTAKHQLRRVNRQLIPQVLLVVLLHLVQVREALECLAQQPIILMKACQRVAEIP